MNILLLSDLIVKSGVGNYVKSLSYELVKKYNKVYLVSPILDLELNLSDDLKYYKIRPISKHIKDIYYNIKCLHKIIKQENIDVVHCNHRMSSFLMKCYNLRYKKIPVVFTCHTEKYPANFVKKIFGNYEDITISISEECSSFLLNTVKLKKSKVELIYNGVDNSDLYKKTKAELLEYYCKYGLSDKMFIIAVHGRIDPVKKIEHVIEALHLLPQNYLNNIKVLCSGVVDYNDDYYIKIKNLISEYKLDDKWVFTGWTKSADILSCSNLIIQPSEREGFSLVAIESMFMKVPMIRTRTGGYEAVKDFCYAVDFGDYKSISELIMYVIENENQVEIMMADAYKFAQKNFTIDIMCRKTIDVYKRVICNNK